MQQKNSPQQLKQDNNHYNSKMWAVEVIVLHRPSSMVRLYSRRRYETKQTQKTVHLFLPNSSSVAIHLIHGISDNKGVHGQHVQDGRSFGQ